jgi:hypothetical protein
VLILSPLHPTVGDRLLMGRRNVGRTDGDLPRLVAVLLKGLDDRYRVTGADRSYQLVLVEVDLGSPFLDRFCEFAEFAVRIGIERIVSAVRLVVVFDAELASRLSLLD